MRPALLSLVALGLAACTRQLPEDPLREPMRPILTATLESMAADIRADRLRWQVPVRKRTGTLLGRAKHYLTPPVASAGWATPFELTALDNVWRGIRGERRRIVGAQEGIARAAWWGQELMDLEGAPAIQVHELASWRSSTAKDGRDHARALEEAHLELGRLVARADELLGDVALAQPAGERRRYVEGVRATFKELSADFLRVAGMASSCVRRLSTSRPGRYARLVIVVSIDPDLEEAAIDLLEADAALWRDCSEDEERLLGAELWGRLAEVTGKLGESEAGRVP